MVARLTGGLAVSAILGALTAVGTVVVIVGLTVIIFFNPAWIDFAQGRAGVPAVIGYTPAQVGEVTRSILVDVFVGPPDFAVAIDGEVVLGPTERSHMVDVRAVVLPFAWLLVLVTGALAAVLAANRRSAWVWRAVACGSLALVIVAAAVGVAVVFFFDAAFLLFHLVFFPQGNFMFDPRTQRLVQLFPDQLWTETAIGIAVVGLALAIVVTLLARRRAARLGR